MKPGLDDTTERVSKVKYLVMIVEDVRLLDSLERSGLLTCRLCYFLSISILLGHSPQQLQRNRRREDYTSRGLHRLWIRMIAIDSVGSLDIVDTNLVIRMCIYTSSREYADLNRCAQYLAESLSRGTLFVCSFARRSSWILLTHLASCAAALLATALGPRVHDQSAVDLLGLLEDHLALPRPSDGEQDHLYRQERLGDPRAH